MRDLTGWKNILSLFITLVVLSACGGGGASSSGNGGSLPTITLSWAAPAAYTDNTSLDPRTDLDRFEIYVNDTGTFADADTPIASVSALTTSFNLGPYLSKGIAYRISMRAVAVTGIKSDFSTPASFSF